MIELITYVTSGFWVFVGSLIFCCSTISAIGWSINSIIIGFKGKRAL